MSAKLSPKILLLTRYNQRGASSRLRFFQYIPYLENNKISVTPSTFFDDKYIITGAASGNSSSGRDFDVLITKDLYVDLSCMTQNSCIITSGEVELIPEGFSNRIINYGDSICNCNFSVTLNGNEYFIVVN